MVREKLSLLNSGVVKSNGIADWYVNFIQENHLKNEKTWEKFVKVFESKEDTQDNGWRGDYWGKMMRGAALCYYYSKDEELYKVLEKTVKNLLSTQDELGRFSAYTTESEFRGWDMWGRKYVATALFHFLDVCKDEVLAKDIIKAVMAHFDYIISKIGDKENQISITKTSGIWGGINSCSILEPTIELYRRTSEKRYLDFAEYIISTGGCANGNIIEDVISNKRPYEWTVKKAYEVISFFEGLLAYYEVLGEKKYLDYVVKFADLVQKNEITIIGCAGLDEECFNDAANKQTVIPEKPTQETCVTVTWMRLLNRLYKATGNVKYFDSFETSCLNAFYGSINVNKLENHSKAGIVMGVFGFDSYSPLLNGYRDTETGGQRKLQDGSYYGCCACIGAVGVALAPLSAVMKNEKGYVINSYFNAEVKDEEFGFNISGDFPNNQSVKITITKAIKKMQTIALRVPSWAAEFSVRVDGIDAVNNNGVILLSKEWQENEQISIDFAFSITSVKDGDYTAFKYGPYVLARDNYKENASITELMSDVKLDLNEYKIKTLEPKQGETLRFELLDDKQRIILTDYASCGKRWDKKDNQISVWLTNK